MGGEGVLVKLLPQETAPFQCQRDVIELRIKFVGIIYRTSSLDAFSIFVSFNLENTLSCDLP